MRDDEASIKKHKSSPLGLIKYTTLIAPDVWLACRAERSNA